MKETEEYSIIVDNVYKTFSVYLDKANTIKEKLLFLFSRNKKEKRIVLQGINAKIKKRRSCCVNRNQWQWKIDTTKINDKNNISQ